jgi:Tfp pilus assembly protein PilF
VASGDALLAARLHVDAEAAYRRALQIDARSVAAGCGLALSLAGKGDGAAALEAARAAAQSDAQSGEALAAAAIAALALDPGDRKSEAAVSAHQAAALEPTSPFVKLVAGRVAESRGQIAEAGTAYAESAALDPTWPAPKIAALALRLHEGDAEAALAGLRALPPEVQAAGEGQLLLGRLLSRKEDWPAALTALEHAAAALPGLADAHALRSVAAYNAGELKLAVESAGRAAALAPSDGALLSRHALYLSYDRRMEEAVAAMQKALALPAGETAEALMALGEIYSGMRPPRVADAVAAYEKAFKLDAKNARPLFGIAESHRAAQQWTRAISAYERISQAFPRLDGQASLGTAWCYLLSGDTTRARFYTGEAVRGGADVGEIREALSAGGASAGALEHAELAQALRSKNAGVQARAARELLERGRPGVPTLAAALGRKGTALPVRELIVEGLATLGPAARDALVQLDRIAKASPFEPAGQAADEHHGLREREAKLSASARAAGEKIRAGTP